MRSFAISAFASLAFGIFCSAAPTPNPAGIALPGLTGGGIVVRDTSVPTEDKCLDSILTTVVTDVTAILEKIEKIETKVTVDVVKPLLGEVVTILEVAVEDVQGLTGLSVDEILKDVLTGDVLDINGVADIIASVIKLVFKLLKTVLGLVSKDGVLSLVTEIVELVAKLLSCILTLVGEVLEGLIKIVVELIKEVVPFILSLKINVIIDLLGLTKA